ncbi:ferric reductase transmembrane component [Ephemerocybe angulata]|uniref:Ferric reductase transmembrane component n=1 Tax=Ephemerocybe angulata TaxID=980116 RepID=A0A8H6M672_9AGAR|nr:ferric reductase transmembrane component [Tulosesus angulatus]
MSSSSLTDAGPTAIEGALGATTTTPGNPALLSQLVISTSLVFQVNLFIYGVIVVLIVYRIPHLIGLFGTSSEWYNGHFLRYVTPRRSKAARAREKVARAMQRNDSARTVVGDDPMDPSKDIPMVEYLRHPNNGRRRALEANPHSRKTFLFPTHVPAVPAALRSLLSASRARGLVPGYSAAQLLVLILYFIVLLYATLYRSNPFIDATRPAWVAVSQIPFVLVMAQKNNVFGWLLGLGYEKLNYLHRFAGRLVVIGSNLHALFYVYRWTAAGTFTQYIALPKNAWGMVMLVAIDVLCVFSTSLWRQKAYTIFIWSHTIAVIMLLPAIYMHQPSLWIYAIISGAVFALDRVLRLAKTRITTAILTPQSSDGIVRVHVPSVNAGWRAGQHVRLRVLSMGGHMGLFGWTEVHPFTIASASASASASGGSGDGLVLLVKKAGDWTEGLGRLAASHRDRLRQRRRELRRESGEKHVPEDDEYDFVEDQDIGVSVRVWLEGPYGGCGRTVAASFSAALIVCGGSGISFGLGLLHDLAAKDAAGESRLKYIELVWVVPEQHALDDSALAELVELVDESNFSRSRHGNGHTEVKVGVWFTRAVTAVGTGRFKNALVAMAKQQTSSSEELDLEDVDVSTRPVGVHPGVVVSPGRPKLGKSLDTLITRAVSMGPGEEEGSGPKGVIVGVCGPRELGDEVVKVVGSVERSRRDQVGGIEIHEETFGM